MWGKIIIISLVLSIPTVSGSCDNGRSILTNITGNITDGDDHYPAYARCEWLIKANEPNKTIYLEFESLNTECSYDFLFIYDGDSYLSPVLASLSGSNTPEPVLAKSGKMLVYLFSDRNYERIGFKAKYVIQECPLDCSGHGNCIDNTCHCFPGRVGSACQREQCPLDCGSHGVCVENVQDDETDKTTHTSGVDGDNTTNTSVANNTTISPGSDKTTKMTTTSVCKCDEGFTGYMCNISLDDSMGSEYWYTVMPEGTGFESRSAHAGALTPQTNCLYIFGGFSLNEILGDLKRFCFKSNKWETLPASDSDPWPSGRYEHAIAEFDQGFYMFGGITVDGSYSNELWYFNTTTERWKHCAGNSSVKPLALSGHTLTTVDDHIYLFGGKTADGRFWANMYKINGSIPEEWEEVKPLGGKSSPRRLIGHSTVYHKESKSLLIYGGYSYSADQPRFGSHTDNLHVFHIENLIWTGISFDGEGSKAPSQRSFHSALIMGNYMVIYGGNTHIHHDLERCYDYEVFLYHLGCHVWVDPTVLMGKYSEMLKTMEKQGRVSHVAVSAYGNMLVVAGGYAGHVRGDLIALKFPPLIAPPQIESGLDLDYCMNHTRREKCQANPDCFYCNIYVSLDKPQCMHRSMEDKCRDSTSYTRRAECPGICGRLSTCLTCLSQGQGATLTAESPEKRTYIQPCNWCVKEARCQRRSRPEGNCLLSHNTMTGMVGWWNGVSASLSQIDQCRLEDYPAGLISVKYRSAINETFTQPDEVKIIRQTIEKETFRHIFVHQKHKCHIQWLGFIHPLNATIKSRIQRTLLYTLKLISENISVTMKLAKYPNSTVLEDIYEIDYEDKSSPGNKEIREFSLRQNGGKLFENISRGNRYYMEIGGNYTYPPFSEKHSVGSKVYELELQWDGQKKNGNSVKNFHPFTFEYLEPYNSDNCSHYTNCLACMTNTNCGWCQTGDGSGLETFHGPSGHGRGSHQCIVRNTSSDLCTGEAQTHKILITEPSVCPVCGDHKECGSCAKDDLCEWVKKDVVCVRRGRAIESDVVRAPDHCLPSCHELKSCSSCLNMTECAWCENLHTCLPFSDYVSRHRYGQCIEWIDSEISTTSNKHTCRDCSLKRSHDICLKTFNCGWCGNRVNPNIGVCYEGDFAGPYHNVSCSELIAAASSNKVRPNDPADWSYGTNPDVEECRLGLADCHPNATCTNTPDSYICSCNRGFVGNGKSCTETCYYKCAHGICLDDEDEHYCDCDLGWTGPDCATDCKCNHHSMCENGTGKCDLCLNGTHGPYCNVCLIGHYGDPSSSQGCFPCSCNGHGNESLGQCNNKTGECYCTENTEGFLCDVCQEGYYGNAINGGRCYLSCDHGLIVENISEGSLGSYSGLGVSTWRAYCLWILSVDASWELKNPPTVTFQIEDIQVQCERDNVYVYDGMPEFVDSEGHGRLLGTFCGFKDHTISVTADSGVVTVYFDADISGNYSTTKGFNASYFVNRCDEHCEPDRHQRCYRSECVCMEGYTGFPDCTQKTCPHGCKFEKEFSSCYCEVNVGSTTYELTKFPWETTELHFPSQGRGHGPVPRYGHVLIYCNDDHMYLFGGRSLAYGLLNDMWTYNLKTNRWSEITLESSLKPSNRYFHTGQCVPSMKILYIFGGLVYSEEDHLQFVASKEMWKFSLENNRWTHPTDPVWVTPLAGHSMTLVDDKLVMIGGFSSLDYFNENVYIINTNRFVKTWDHHSFENKTGAKPIGIYGHSAVYNAPSKTIYIYGGVVYSGVKLQMSESLYTYDVTANSWNILQPEARSMNGLRHFPSAVGFDDYMVVLGGFAQRNATSNLVAIYMYKCNVWHYLNIIDMGSDLTSNIAASAVRYNDSMYVFGGINDVPHNDLYKLRLPTDVCQIHNEANNCEVPGCSYMVKNMRNGSNETRCFSAEIIPQQRKNMKLFQGEVCNKNSNRQSRCEHRKSCAECVAAHPQFKSSEPSCYWCGKCLLGQCVSPGFTCEGNNKCEIVPITSHNSSMASGLQTSCMVASCRTSSCKRCEELDCKWSDQFTNVESTSYRSYVAYRNMQTKSETSEWSCVSKQVYNLYKHQMTLKECPAPCYTYRSCKDCLNSTGGEGGSRECFWSEHLHECMPPAYLSLSCLGGECGTILQGDEAKCPKPCNTFTKCADCRRAQSCGWCAYEGQNGKGTCMEGTRNGPSRPEMCMKQNSPPGEKITDVDRNERNPTWAYAHCPPENECENEHHDCDTNTEECKDKLNGFQCTCKKGYRSVEDEGRPVCEPVCHQECKHGNCVLPDMCRCHFGYVGENCDKQCECNGHSTCESVDRRDVCTQCMNNTQGKNCERCKPLYVGNPVANNRCISCTDFCNGHSDICLYYTDITKEALQDILRRYPDTSSPAFRNAFKQMQGAGPTMRNKTKCLMCGDNTEGSRCEKCKSGYFRLSSTHDTERCEKCMCNGHSEICDSNSGLNCKCQNNTETRCSPADGKNDVKCHLAQCADCKEYFLGKPTGGHHCYRTMTVNKDYCLDPMTQAECTRSPAPLIHGRTVFFVVQPKYVNVDIRVTVDVTEGEVDVFFSPQEDTFVVKVDNYSGNHHVKLDPGYGSYITNRRRRELNVIYAEQTIPARTVQAKSINTFITVDFPETILMVTKLRGRLVITLPNDKLNLKTSRFYMVVYSKGDRFQNSTFGNLNFRQDQPHIDLFVFFSVFFSCFFLFLAMCVLLWKTKQGFDAQRMHRERAREMHDRASRPFTKVLVNIDHLITPYNISPNLRNVRSRKPNDRTPLLSTETSVLPFSQTHNTSHALNIVPIAIEPTEDSVAAIGTLVFQLPGGSAAPAQLCLGSALITQSQVTGKNRRQPMSSNC